MIIPADTFLDAAKRLYGYLLKEHWNERALAGPDAGIRFNSRIWRFMKSYLDFVPWSDNLTYMQAQGYWIFDNWLLNDILGIEQGKDVAIKCAEYVLATQRHQGYWQYPNPEWKERIATVEGDFAALGMLETYCRTQDPSLLAGAKKWYRFLIDEVGFQGNTDLHAINYFANVPSSMVPNNTTLTLLTLAKLADATGDDQYLQTCKGMVAWLSKVQLDTGELPYAVESSQGKQRTHFLCYQYNAFEFIDLVHYYRITEDQAVWPILERLAIYLSTGISDSGAAFYACGRARPEVPYYTAAVAAALSQATAMQIGDFRSLADRAFRRVLAQQRVDGGFECFSRGNYRILTDTRSYPRPLSMILYHLLLEVQTRADIERGQLTTDERR